MELRIFQNQLKKRQSSYPKIGDQARRNSETWTVKGIKKRKLRRHCLAVKTTPHIPSSIFQLNKRVAGLMTDGIQSKPTKWKGSGNTLEQVP